MRVGLPASSRPLGVDELTPALLGLIAGVALQLQQATLWPLPAYAGLVLRGLLALLALRQLAPRWLRAAVAALALAALAAGSTGWRAVAYAAAGLPAALQGQDIELVGRVAAMPQWADDGVRFRFAVEEARHVGRPVAVPRLLYLSWYGGPRRDDDGTLQTQRLAPDLQAGQRWRFTARLRVPHGARNPHGFDYELWLWEQGLQAVGYVRAGRSDPPPQNLGASGAHPVEWARQQVRDAIVRRAPAAAADDAQHGISLQRALGIVAALVTGDQRAIARSDWDVFRATGVAHLMSISGLHITLFAWLAAALIGALWRRWPALCLRWPAQQAGALGGLLLAAAYALFSGWGIPAQRTVLMLATVTLLRLGARRWPWPQLWLLVAAVVLLADPWALLQPGFWLSFVAVGILFASGRRERADAPGGWRARALALLREQLLITAALAPLTLLFFGQVSLVGLLANLLAIPWVTLVLTPLALLGVLWAPLWDLAALAAQGLAAVLQPMAAWPLATWSAPQAPPWVAAAAIAGGLLLALRLPPTLRGAGVPLLLPALLWQVPGPPAGEFELLAADIGQGQAVLVRTERHALLYDAGPRYSNDSDAGQRVLVPLLRALDVRLDRLVLSHADTDHTGGAAAVLAMHPQADLLGTLHEEHELLRLRPQQPCQAGVQWVWDGVRFEVLHPVATEAARRPRRSNALSCVLRISNERQAVLLAGDIERAQEQRLLQAGTPLQADVLLVPHHGSKTSSSPAFVQAVAPRYALVQAGYRNRYGHPAPEVTARYVQQGSIVVRSDACGAAHWQSQRPHTIACERQLRRRYWQHDLGAEPAAP